MHPVNAGQRSPTYSPSRFPFWFHSRILSSIHLLAVLRRLADLSNDLFLVYLQLVALTLKVANCPVDLPLMLSQLFGGGEGLAKQAVSSLCSTSWSIFEEWDFNPFVMGDNSTNFPGSKKVSRRWRWARVLSSTG